MQCAGSSNGGSSPGGTQEEEGVVDVQKSYIIGRARGIRKKRIGCSADWTALSPVSAVGVFTELSPK